MFEPSGSRRASSGSRSHDTQVNPRQSNSRWWVGKKAAARANESSHAPVGKGPSSGMWTPSTASPWRTARPAAGSNSLGYAPRAIPILGLGNETHEHHGVEERQRRGGPAMEVEGQSRLAFEEGALRSDQVLGDAGGAAVVGRGSDRLPHPVRKSESSGHVDDLGGGGNRHRFATTHRRQLLHRITATGPPQKPARYVPYAMLPDPSPSHSFSCGSSRSFDVRDNDEPQLFW